MRYPLKPDGALIARRLTESGRRGLIDDAENAARGCCIQLVWRACRDGKRSNIQIRQTIAELNPTCGAIDTLVYPAARSPNIKDIGLVRGNHQSCDRRANIRQAG